MRRAFILALAWVAVFAMAVGAQTLTGTIEGVVTDQQGGVLPGVTVTVTGAQGVKTVVTDAKGEYRFVGLTPGRYQLKAELQGFRTAARQDLDITMGKTIGVPLGMTVGGMSEVVDVVANAVSVDTKTTATDVNMGQSLLFSMPITHLNAATNLLNYSPGVNDQSAFGGSAQSGNNLMLDGVDTRDPDAGTAWTFYNYNIIDEVQVGSLGQPAEYGGFTGAMVNTITKSGGNRYSALAEYRYTTKSLGASNVSAANIALNKNLAKPSLVLDYKDYTVQLGGPIIKDKLFFFASAQRYAIKQQQSAGPDRGEISPRFNLKFTWQPSSSDTLTAWVQYDQYNQTGRTGLIPGYAVTNHSQTIDQDSPEYIWNAQYRKVIGSSTFLEAKFLGYWGYYDLNPVSQAPYHLDLGTGLRTGGAGYWYMADRTRNQLNLSLSKYAGAHSFKFGAEIERSNLRSRFGYVGTPGVYYHDYYGKPYYAYGYTYDIKGTNKRESFYAQDQWKLGSFATLNLGVRADNIHGYSPVLKKSLYSSFSVAPRLGLAFDLSGKGSSVVRAFYGQMYDGAIFSSWGRAVPGLTDFITYGVGNNWSSLTEVSRSPADNKYTIGKDLKHPRVDEVNISWEQQIGKTFKFTSTGIYRSWKNFLNSLLINGTWSPATYTTSYNNESLTLWKWANKGVVPQQYLVQNVDNAAYTLAAGGTMPVNAYRNYKGLMFVLQKAMKDRWQGQISYVLSFTNGTVGQGSTTGVSSGQFETPNGIMVNADGPTSYDRRHEIKVFVGYQIPVVEVGVNAYWRWLSGWPYAPYVSVSSSTLAWTSSQSINVEPRGFYLTDNESTLDLRLEKVFNVGFHRFGVYADLTNALNAGYVTSRNSRYPSTTLRDSAGVSFVLPFKGPTALNSGRQITFGVRWSF